MLNASFPWMKRWIAGMALMAILMISVANLQGFVFCFEADGRVFLENISSGLCCEQPPTQTVSASQSELNLSHCLDACTDVPLRLTQWAPQTQQTLTSTLLHALDASDWIASAPPWLSPSSLYLSTATVRHMPIPPPEPVQRHPFLRVTILLI